MNPITNRQDLIEDIQRLKQKHQVLLLAHYYQDGDIQDIADFCGDSLFLAQKGQESQAPVVLLAGVVFMAESVKILSPNKKVLVPDFEAGCSLVSGTPTDQFIRWRQQYPEHISVTYINSSAEVKAASDVICTSSNAEKIIQAIPKERGILFAPDRNLGRFLEKKSGREMIQWPGACEVHVLFSAKKLFTLKEEHPTAVVLAHPECEESVLAYADFIGSTSAILDQVRNNQDTNTFIVATETGIFHQLQKARPNAKIIQAPFEGQCQCNDCPYMKLNSLEKIHRTLSQMDQDVQVPSHLIEKARVPLDRMMRLTRGETVSWPQYFEHPTH
jgi:quinolinate synthase